jgi:hypothetical protein
MSGDLFNRAGEREKTPPKSQIKVKQSKEQRVV